MAPGEILEQRKEATAPAKEVMEHLYAAIVAAPEFTLKDGRTAKTETLGAPEVNEDGDPTFSFNVAIDDGSLLEFSVNNTGLGRSFVQV
jgi:hypothetical protein